MSEALLEFVNIAGHYLTLAFVVSNPGALFCLFLSVFTNCAEHIDDKIKGVLVVIE